MDLRRGLTRISPDSPIRLILLPAVKLCLKVIYAGLRKISITQSLKLWHSKRSEVTSFISDIGFKFQATDTSLLFIEV